jgi:hypothetical protein
LIYIQLAGKKLSGELEVPRCASDILRMKQNYTFYSIQIPLTKNKPSTNRFAAANHFKNPASIRPYGESEYDSRGAES